MNPLDSNPVSLTDGRIRKPKAKKDKAQGDVKSPCAVGGKGSDHGGAGRGLISAGFALHGHDPLSISDLYEL